MSNAVLSVHGLSKSFVGRSGFRRAAPVTKAVDDVQFQVGRGEAFGIVGESGSGKSTTARLILRLIQPDAGSVLFEGNDLLSCSASALRALRRHLQFVPQDARSSLNPRMTVAASVAEPLRFYGEGDRKSRMRRAQEAFEVVGLRPELANRFPHQLSGGQCQRIAIARALIVRPQLIVFDEPVSALDVSTQAQVLQLLLRLKADFRLSYVFISHDLAIVKRLCARIAVMYRGRIVENGPSQDVCERPAHRYTAELIASIPIPDPTAARIRAQTSLAGAREIQG